MIDSIVIFVSSLACYDRFLVEDPTINQMADALVLFEKLINNLLLKDKFFVLLLNKKDIFARKIRTVPIKPIFPEYEGKEFSANAVSAFIKDKFLKQQRVVDLTKSQIVVHATCCTDINSMKILLRTILYNVINIGLVYFDHL
jgi:hypothetical protein